MLEPNLEELTCQTRIVENMLFLVQADHTTLKANRMPLALADELNKIADHFKGLAPERDMSFIVEASGTIHVYAITWRRAVNNPVTNAIRYGEIGTCIRYMLAKACGARLSLSKTMDFRCNRNRRNAGSAAFTGEKNRAANTSSPMDWGW